MSNDGFVQRGGIWVLSQGLLLLGVIASALLWRNQWRSSVAILCGILLLLAAGVCGIAGVLTLGRNLTPFPRPSASTRLAYGGIYALMRHPLYTAVMCGSVGWALVWASWPALLAALALAPFFDAKARREERWLRQRFPEYAGYEQRVRRFLPGIY
jgi:protein-S-isoprenylcysteine O-methyltransferase Ste14